MAGAESRSFDSPDEVRTPDKSKVESVSLDTGKVGRATFQPGWRWSECIKPVVGGDKCQVDHLGVMVSGQLRVAHDDGSEADLGPGSVYHIKPGHDAWVVGDEPAVMYEFNSQAAASYAKPS